MLAVVLFVLLTLIAAMYIRITGAVSAPGIVVQTGENKSVQHPEGGPVARILVQEGDLVAQGEPLVVLDGAQIASQHRILTRREFELQVRLARLRALDSDTDDFEHPLPRPQDRRHRPKTPEALKPGDGIRRPASWQSCAPDQSRAVALRFSHRMTMEAAPSAPTPLPRAPSRGGLVRASLSREAIGSDGAAHAELKRTVLRAGREALRMERPQSQSSVRAHKASLAIANSIAKRAAALRLRLTRHLSSPLPVRATRVQLTDTLTVTSDGAFEQQIDALFARDVIATQKEVFHSHRRRMESMQRRLNSRIAGLEIELAALDRQIATNSLQIGLLREEIKDVTELHEEQLVSKARLVALKRQRVAVRADIDALRLSKARTQNALIDSRNELEVLQREDREAIWRQIEEVQGQLEEVTASLTAARDRLTRLVITAPATGRIHELMVRNVNAVIAAGQTILQVVPVDAGPVLNARVGPVDIDQVHIGQHVRIRFDAFDMRTTPEVQGQVVRISADRSVDEQTGEAYYVVWIDWPNEELDGLREHAIIPGLPATAMFTTSERTLLDYLTKPLRTQLFAAFRED